MEHCSHEAGIAISLATLGLVELVFGGLALNVVVAKDLLEDGADASEVFWGQSYSHC